MEMNMCKGYFEKLLTSKMFCAGSISKETGSIVFWIKAPVSNTDVAETVLLDRQARMRGVVHTLSPLKQLNAWATKHLAEGAFSM